MKLDRRNAPCPCGSGLKYKKCCATREVRGQNARAARIHELDEQLNKKVMRALQEWHPACLREAVAEYTAEDRPVEPTELPMAIPWALHHRSMGEGDMRTPYGRFEDEKGSRLSSQERAYMEAQSAAWLSIWEVLETEPGSWMRMRDLLTGEERKVWEVQGSRSISPRTGILVRIVDFEDVSVLAGSASHTLPPLAVARLVESLNEEYGMTGAWLPEQLRDEETTLHLMHEWNAAIHEASQVRLPRVTNREGHAMVSVEDPFHFPLSQRPRVLEALGRLSGARKSGKCDGVDMVHVVRDLEQALSVEVATIEVEDVRLVIKTNSRERANSVRAEVEAVCGDLVRRGRRRVQDMTKLLREQGEGVAEEEPGARGLDTPEAHAAVRAYKERHYAGWVHEEIPALHGLTPVQAVRTPEGRARVDALVKDIERMESLGPPAARFDVTPLREVLGLD